jgi:hypothetical protein
MSDHNATTPESPRYRRTTNAVLRLVAGEHLLVPIRPGRTLDAESLYILDDIGAWVWEALADPVTPEALAAGVREAFDTAPGDAVEADLDELLVDLVAQGLVNREPPT